MTVSLAAAIYLVRHGETEWNASGRFQGKLDSPLTAKGVSQAEAYAKRLSSIAADVDTLVASPLGRVRQTTAIIESLTPLPPAQWDSRLSEVSTGSWDGLTHIEFDAQWPDVLAGATPFDWFFRSRDGESYNAAAARVREWLGELQGMVVAVSHGLIGRIIRGSYLGLAKEEALSLAVPQDVIWRLSQGQIEAIST